MKYEVQKGCVIKGSAYQPGAVVEVDDVTARALMGIGRIAPHDDSVVVDRSVGLSDSSAGLKRRGRPKKIDQPVDELLDDN